MYYNNRTKIDKKEFHEQLEAMINDAVADPYHHPDEVEMMEQQQQQQQQQQEQNNHNIIGDDSTNIVDDVLAPYQDDSCCEIIEEPYEDEPTGLNNNDALVPEHMRQSEFRPNDMLLGRTDPANSAWGWKPVEVKTSSDQSSNRRTKSKSKKQNSRTKKLQCGLYVGIIGLVLFILLTVHYSRRNQLGPQIYDHTETETKKLQLSAVRHQVMPISGREVLFNTSSHQYKALEWVVNHYNSLMEENKIQETYVITLLYYLTVGEQWTSKHNFLNSSVSVCDWHVGSDQGVYCDSDHSVNRLSLQKSNLQGKIPHELFYLSNMEHFYVYDNQLTGTIPVEIASYHSLRMVHFAVDDNQLTGTIPRKFHELTHLETFSAQNNKLRGWIPSEFGTFTKLTHFNVMNNLIRGSLPTEFGRITSLNTLELANNRFTGTIPSELGNLHSLTRVELSHNQMSGDLNPIFCDSSDIRDVFPEELKVVEADSCTGGGEVTCSCCCCTDCA